MSRALILGGGAFRCAFQVPILELLNKKYAYNDIYAVSGGALNGILYAQKELKLLRDMWESVNGISKWLEINRWPTQGILNTSPLRRIIEQHVALNKIHIPMHIGMISNNTKIYHTVSSDKVFDDVDIWDALEASVAIKILMQKKDIKINGCLNQCIDGMRPPRPKKRYKYIDLVLCNTLDNNDYKKYHKTNALNAILNQIENFENNLFYTDYQYLQNYLLDDGMLRIFYPIEHLGASFDATPSSIKHRLNVGQSSLTNYKLFIN